MPKHGGRTLTVRCNCADVTVTPPSFFKAGKYEFDYPNDDLGPGLINNAIAQYRLDYGIPGGLTVTTTTSIRHNR